MPDTFSSFKELAKSRPNHYRIDLRDQGGKMLIFTPHGGGIEPGTSELCRWFRRRSYATYCFEGIKSPCKELHVTSTRFDEPQLLVLLSRYKYALSFHGMANSVKRKVSADIFLGGRNKQLIIILPQFLEQAGFSVATVIRFPLSTLAASSKNNVSNRCSSQQGLQIEISESLRRKFFNGSLTRPARTKKPAAIFYQFCIAVEKGITAFLKLSDKPGEPKRVNKDMAK